jgi:hypothetical protein
MRVGIVKAVHHPRRTPGANGMNGPTVHLLVANLNSRLNIPRVTWWSRVVGRGQ